MKGLTWLLEQESRMSVGTAAVKEVKPDVTPVGSSSSSSSSSPSGKKRRVGGQSNTNERSTATLDDVLASLPSSVDEWTPHVLGKVLALAELRLLCSHAGCTFMQKCNKADLVSKLLIARDRGVFWRSSDIFMENDAAIRGQWPHVTPHLAEVVACHMKRSALLTSPSGQAWQVAASDLARFDRTQHGIPTAYHPFVCSKEVEEVLRRQYPALGSHVEATVAGAVLGMTFTRVVCGGRDGGTLVEREHAVLKKLRPGTGGRLKPGDILTNVNDRHVAQLTFAEQMRLLKESSRPLYLVLRRRPAAIDLT